MGLLDGKVAVVTGAGRGIGHAIALTLVREGAACMINDVDGEPAESVLKQCGEMGGRAAVFLGSVAERAATDAMMGETVERLGGLDILVNNAGVTRDRVVHKMSDEEWDLVIDVNLKGTFNCIRSAAPFMRDAAKQEIKASGDVSHHRKIVNLYSTAAIRGNPGQINYTAAKMGNVGITRTVAQEWAAFKINVNAVGPGFIDTRMTKPKEEMAALGYENMGIPAERRQAVIDRIPFKRAGTPQDVANAVLFFVSPLSDYVTGQEINVSGGFQIP